MLALISDPNQQSRLKLTYYPFRGWKLHISLAPGATGGTRTPPKSQQTTNHSSQASQLQHLTMAGPRRSGRTVKPKQHFESTPYPTRKPRSAPPKPQEVLQPMLAEGIPPPDSDLTDAPLEFPLFEPLDIKPHNAVKRSPLGEISGNQGAPSRSSWGCKQCRVVLCRDGGCWEAFHTVEE